MYTSQVSYIMQNRSLLVLFSALLVAVAALTAVSFFADRVNRSLVLQGAALQAADLVVEQPEKTPDEWRTKATSLGLETSLQITFPSVVFHEDNPILIQVKAVDQHYPLRGTLEVETTDGLSNQPVPAGSAYAEPRLFSELGIDNLNSAIPLGESTPLLSGRMLKEPDRGGSLFQLAPRLMINLQDLETTGLLGPASRAKHRLLIAGEQQSLGQYRQWLTKQLPPNTRLSDVESARPELRDALERGRRFLALAALCASLLAGVAIMLATKHYVYQALNAAAVMRTIGMTGNQVLIRHLKELLLVMLGGCFLGIAVGYLGQSGLTYLIGDWFGGELPAPGMRSVFVGLLYGTCLLFGFSLPAFIRIRKTPPLRVLRHDLMPPDISAGISWGIAILAFTLLVVWQVEDHKLAIAMVLALTAILLLLMLIGRIMIYLLAPFRKQGSSIGFGLTALTREPVLTLWQLSGFGLGISLLLLLGVVRVDLLDTWRNNLPKEAPNHFLINIQPGEKEGLQALLEKSGIPGSGMFATTRARLTHLDDQVVKPESYTTARARRLASREYSLGFSNDLQSDNRIIKGQPWEPERFQSGGFTVEEGVAEKLGIKVGTQITFDIAGQSITAPAINIRTVSWDSFNVNFFIQGSEDLMQDIPVAYLSSIYLDDNTDHILKTLGENYPALSIIDIRPLLQQVRDIMDKGVLAVEAMFGFTLLAAILVTIAAVQISREERSQEIAILRTLGASKGRVLKSIFAEFGLLGLLAGFAASLLASITGYLIGNELFELNAAFNLDVIWIGIMGGTIGLCLVGYLATASLLNTPPTRILSAQE